MAFDTATRNELQRMVGAARECLVNEFTTQCQRDYGIQPDGSMQPLESLGHLDEYQRVRAVLLRERARHIAAGLAGKTKDADAVKRLVREQAFTVLNRLCALRMCEERGLVQECVRGGYESKGFRLFDQATVRPLGATYERYRLYLELLFDELAVDLGVLFDRYSLHGLLFPGETALKATLELIDASQLAHVWAEDEAIGWVYQYFNSEEERRRMRKESSSPRNSRELAIRNQFFTPRYVVEFLTDNTLGRIWHEMRKGDTELVGQCRYLLRRPSEIFLAAGEHVLSDEGESGRAEQAEGLTRPIHIVHRDPKDPRDLKVLDPASGSGHFLLYAFDLLVTIYEEAWADPEAPSSDKTGKRLSEDYGTIEELRAALPALILRHNLWGIDIDPRAAQIAALALWLRAQRAWKDQGAKPADPRRRVERSNIVSAEPMPGERELLEEFTGKLRPRLLGQLVEAVFERMRLAGEAGSLLKIEREIAAAISTAREECASAGQVEMDTEVLGVKESQGAYDLTGVTDAVFWESIEKVITDALEEYAETAQAGNGLSRRLFAEDAVQGFAFLDLCRQRFDVVLMNPPFGRASKRSDKYLRTAYAESGPDELAATFVTRALDLLNPDGFFGAISTRTFFYLSSLSLWRTEILHKLATLDAFVDLGIGVLDDATNETAMYLGRAATERRLTEFFTVHHVESKETALDEFVSGSACTHLRSLDDFRALPDMPLSYWVSSEFLDALRGMKTLGASYADVQMGLAPRDEFRFSRLWWEVPCTDIGSSRAWVPYAKGGELSAYYSDIDLVLLGKDDLKEIKASLNAKYPYLKGNLSWVLHPENRYFEPGLTFGQRTRYLRVSILPEGCFFSVAGKAIFGRKIDNMALLQAINTAATQFLTYLRRESFAMNPQFQEGGVSRVPWPELHPELAEDLKELGMQNWTDVRRVASYDETDHVYCGRPFTLEAQSAFSSAKEAVSEREEYANSIMLSSLQFRTQDLQFLESEILPGWRERTTVNWYRSKQGLAVHYAVGTAFGRFDVRLAARENPGQSSSGCAFRALPTFSPGMLADGEGHPCQYPKDYPISFPLNGVLCLDCSEVALVISTSNIVAQVSEVLRILWPTDHEDCIAEQCRELGVNSIADYLAKPTKFFADHLSRYSKSGRKAPIYWPLSSESGSYTLWLYYPRLSDQTLYACVVGVRQLHIVALLSPTLRSDALRLRQ